MVQEVCVKVMEYLLVNYNVQAETKALGIEEEVTHLVREVPFPMTNGV